MYVHHAVNFVRTRGRGGVDHEVKKNTQELQQVSRFGVDCTSKRHGIERSHNYSSSPCRGQDEEGNPKKPKTGLLGLGGRLAAKAAAIAKTAENALQAVSESASPALSPFIFRSALRKGLGRNGCR